MQRAKRQPPLELIPVMSGPRCIARVAPAEILHMAMAPNVCIVRERRGGIVTRINVANHGDDTREPARLGNPQRYSHDSETGQNPANVWMLKLIALRDRAAFKRVVAECRAA